MEKIRYPEIIDFGGLDGPGGPRNHFKRRGTSRPAGWKVNLPGVAGTSKSMKLIPVGRLMTNYM